MGYLAVAVSTALAAMPAVHWLVYGWVTLRKAASEE